MLETYYHATPYENSFSIIANGIKANYEGIVYLTKEMDDAIKFVAVRGCRDILIIEVSVDDEKVEETFDHSYSFFKCKAFGYNGDINVREIKNFYRCKL